MKTFKRLFIFLIIIVALALLSIFWPNLTGESVASSGSSTDYQREPAVVTRVVDGDTIHVYMNGKDETIMLLGINNPKGIDIQEINTPHNKLILKINSLIKIN